MDKASFLYALLYGDSIDLPSFICHHILRTFWVHGHKIGLPYAYLFHRLATSLRITFPDTVLKRVSQPIGHITIS